MHPSTGCSSRAEAWGRSIRWGLFHPVTPCTQDTVSRSFPQVPDREAPARLTLKGLRIMRVVGVAVQLVLMVPVVLCAGRGWGGCRLGYSEGYCHGRGHVPPVLSNTGRHRSFLLEVRSAGLLLPGSPGKGLCRKVQVVGVHADADVEVDADVDVHASGPATHIFSPPPQVVRSGRALAACPYPAWPCV